jgi:ABC-type glycerol-3-phosphate transport system substrate-binding protein
VVIYRRGGFSFQHKEVSVRVTGLWHIAAVLWLFAGSAAARDLVIVTSFPKELFETYKKNFEAKNPGINVVINSKQTNAGVTYYLLARNQSQTRS